MIEPILVVMAFFFKQALRSPRTRLFFALSLLPVLAMSLIRGIALLYPKLPVDSSKVFAGMVMLFYFQIFIPLLALFFGTSVVNEELDNKTLVYLTTATLAKAGLLLGKYLAYLVVMILIVAIGLVLCFAISYWPDFWHAVHLKLLFGVGAIAGLAILAYSALFTLIGCFLKRAVVTGIVIIFGWESFVQYLPGLAQHLTLSFYCNSLLIRYFSTPQSLPPTMLFADPTTAVITLLAASVIFCSLGILLFTKKEYLLSDSDY